MNLQAQRDISRKLKVFEHAAKSGNVAFTCRHLVFQEIRFINGSGLMWHVEK